ncbi:MAG: carbohydrate ABC transporter permease [Fimbriimonadaceae bacterium]|nr:carbohydrate ABC transporter permease [Fimbriimonadaceae bacterium]
MQKAILWSRAHRGIVLTLLALGSLVFMTPFYLMLVMSLKSKTEVGTTSIWAWPKAPSLHNYEVVLTNPNVNFTLLFKNTLVIGVVSTLGVVLTASLVAYAFARMQFRGRDRLFLVLLSTMMLPAIVTMIPSYVLYRQLGWINTALPLTVPAFFGGGAFNIFLLRQYYMGIPRELDEAALLDGASHWTVYWRILLPLSGPALATVAIFHFVFSWRDFLGPLMVLNDPDRMTLEVGLSAYNSLRATEWELIMAGSVLVSLPLVILFFIGQRYFVKGIVMSGLK